MVERLVLFFLLFFARLDVALTFTAEGPPGRSSTDASSSPSFGRIDQRVAVLIEEPLFEEEARTIASELNLSVVTLGALHEQQQQDFEHVLRLVPFEVSGRDPTYALALEGVDAGIANHKGNERRLNSKSAKSKPCFVELCPSDSSRIGKRGIGESGSDLLIKAVGPRKVLSGDRQGAVVYDLTAGLAQDSLVLALNGASEVHMVERDPIVAALLRDAIRRLDVLSHAPGQDSRADRAAELSKKLHLHCGDSTKVLKDLLSSGIHPHPDIVYLDPMFPPRKKSAKVKKGMTILHSLLDTQSSDTTSEDKRLQDELLLLEESIKAAKRKVVVKRPAKAVPLGGEMSPFRASYAIEGSVNRWDIYVK